MKKIFGEKRSRRVALMLPPPLFEKLSIAAQYKRISFNQLVNILLADYVNENSARLADMEKALADEKEIPLRGDYQQTTLFENFGGEPVN